MTKYKYIPPQQDWAEILAHTYELIEEHENDAPKAKEAIIRYHKEKKLDHRYHQFCLKGVSLAAIGSYKELLAEFGAYDFRTIHEREISEKAASLWSESGHYDYIADYQDGSVELAASEVEYLD